MSLKRRLIKSFMGVGLMRMLSIPVGLVISIILARALGPEDFGQYAFVLGMISLLSVPVNGGIPQLLTREVAMYIHSNRWSLYKGIVVASHGWVILVSSAIIGLYILLTEVLGLLPTEEKWGLLAIAILMLPFLGLGAIRNGTVKGLGMPAYAEVPDQLIKPLLLMAIFWLMSSLQFLNKETAIWGQVLAAAVVFISASWMFFIIRPKKSASIKPDYQLGEWAEKLFPFTMLAVIYTSNASLAIVVLGFVSDNDQVAAMHVAERAGNVVVLSLTLVNVVISPYIVKAYKQGHKQRLQDLAVKSARGSFLLALPVAIVLWIYGDWIIERLYGVEYSNIAYIPVVVMAAGQIVNVFYGSVGNLLSMTGHVNDTLKGLVAAVVVNLLLCLILAPLYGAIGAAISVSASIVMWNVILGFMVERRLKIKYRAF